MTGNGDGLQDIIMAMELAIFALQKFGRIYLPKWDAPKPLEVAGSSNIG